MRFQTVNALLLAVLGGGLLSLPAHAQLVPPAPTSLPAPLTLSQAIAIALAHEPQSYSARAQTSQSLGQRQQAMSAYFPVLTPTYQFQNTSRALYGLTTGTSSTTGTTTPAVSIVRGGGLTIALSQSLFDTGQRELSNAQARRGVEAAQYNEVNTRQNIVLTVTQDYYNLLQAIDLVKVAQAQVNRFQQTVDLTQAQITAGTTAPKDIYQSRADLATAQVSLLQNQNQVRTASAALKNALGVETDQLVQPAPLSAGDQLPPLPTAGQERALDDYIRTAYQSRPDLRQQQAIVAGQNSAVKAAQLNTGISLGGTFTLSYQATNDLGNRGLDTQFLLTSSYPLFDAGRARGQVRVARAQRDVSQNTLVQIRQGIRQDVEQAYSTRGEALEATRLAQAAVSAAQVNYDAAVEARRAGVGTIVDITTAQATLTQAQNQYVTAIYNFYTADAQLLRAIGQNAVAAPAPTP